MVVMGDEEAVVDDGAVVVDAEAEADECAEDEDADG
jgi:hypothetical protein